MSKVLTKDCSSCAFLKVTDDNEFLCLWGKSKKRKKLVEGKNMEDCKLIEKKEVENENLN